MIRHLILTVLVLLATSSPVVAQEQGPSDDFLPNLPNHVSDVAKQVLDTIAEFFSDPLGSLNDLGSALGGMLGGGNVNSS